MRPTALRLSPVELPARSGEAHCDQELADEVRRGPLRSRAGSGGPARPTAIESWQLRSGEAHCDQELADEVRRGGRRSRASDIKSNNPHLAGGEQSLDLDSPRYLQILDYWIRVFGLEYWIPKTYSSKLPIFQVLISHMNHYIPLI